MPSPAEPRPPGARGTRRALAIVPARLGSTRMPRKMLRRDTGRYLFEHTVRNAERATALERVVLATDAPEIVEAARGVGIEALLTSPEHQSGTDRVHEALGILRERGAGDYDVVVNVQGDEPDLPAEDLALLVGAFADGAVDVATLCSPVATREEAADPAVVKVVRDARGDALYFSRSPIPSLEHPSRARRAGASGADGTLGVLRHIGVYAFRPAALAEFCALPVGALERIECLEQLRWLEAGRRMRVLLASRTTFGIDTEADYAAFVARRKERAEPVQKSESSRAR